MSALDYVANRASKLAWLVLKHGQQLAGNCRVRALSRDLQLFS